MPKEVIDESLVESTLRKLRRAETHDLVEEISKTFPSLSKEAIRKKVLKKLRQLEREGRVTKVKLYVERRGEKREMIVEADVWVPSYFPEMETLPRIGWNGYYKITDEKPIIKAVSKALTEWCQETYNVPTEVRINRGISLVGDLRSKLTLSVRIKNLNGVVLASVSSASLPVSATLSPETFMAKLVFYLQGDSFVSGPGATMTRVIRVLPNGNEHDMGMQSFAPTWVISLNAWPDDPTFDLLYNYEKVYKSDSLLDQLILDALVDHIRRQCKRYGVRYTLKWFQMRLYPKVEEEVILPIKTEQLIHAIKTLLSTKHETDIFLKNVKKRFTDVFIGWNARRHIL